MERAGVQVPGLEGWGKQEWGAVWGSFYPTPSVFLRLVVDLKVMLVTDPVPPFPLFF